MRADWPAAENSMSVSPSMVYAGMCVVVTVVLLEGVAVVLESFLQDALHNSNKLTAKGVRYFFIVVIFGKSSILVLPKEINCKYLLVPA